MSVAANKTRQMELEIEKEEQKSRSKRNEISHRVNETIRSKNHDELLKRRAKEQKLRERANRFRECGERMGGTNVLAVQPGHHASVATPTAFDDPAFDHAVNSYLQGKASKLIKGLVRKHAAGMKGKQKKKTRHSVVTPTAKDSRKRTASLTPTKPRRRPKTFAEAIRMCPDGWNVFDIDGDIFFKNKDGLVLMDPPEEATSPVAVAAAAATPPKSPMPLNDSDDDDDSAKSNDQVMVPTKTTGLESSDDDEDGNEDDDDDGSSKANKPLSDETNDEDDNGSDDDDKNDEKNNFGISQSFNYDFDRAKSDDDDNDNNDKEEEK